MMKPQPVPLETIWNDYGERLRRFLRARVSRPEDADDLAQEILIKVHSNLSQLQDSGKLQSWLFQIARNALTDHHRKSAASRSRQDAAENENHSDSENTARLELTRCLEPFLQELPDKYRDAVTAVDLNGEAQNRLAEKYGISYSALKSRVQRGRAMLKDLFFKCCAYEIDARGRIVSYQSKRDCC